MACITLVGKTGDIHLVFSLVWHNLIKTHHKPPYRTADTDYSGLKLGHMKQSCKTTTGFCSLYTLSLYIHFSAWTDNSINTHITASESTINNKMIQVTDKLFQVRIHKGMVHNTCHK